MKKQTTLLSSLILLLGVSSLTSCNDNLVELPDITNLKKEEAIALLKETSSDFDIRVVEEETTKVIEGRSFGYLNKEIKDKVKKNETISLKVGKRVSGAIEGSNDKILYLSDVGKMTGADSTNDEMTYEVGVRGCDLGIPFELPDGKTMLLFGDTFSGERRVGAWKSNYMAVSSDYDLSDGLTFDYIVQNEFNGAAQPFAEGLHQHDGSLENDGTEVTKIPTGGISIGNDVYIFYMSIRYWGTELGWLVSYSQCLKASDETYTKWENVESLKWTDSEFFYGGQIFPVRDPKDQEHIYFTSIPGGRTKQAVMFRVDVDKFENRDEYEYQVGPNEWVKGDTGMARLNQNPYFITPQATSEPSIMYSKYLDKYLYESIVSGGVGLFISDTINGPYQFYSSVKTPLSTYSHFLYEKYNDTDGQRLFVPGSNWGVYNVFLYELVLA